MDERAAEILKRASGWSPLPENRTGEAEAEYIRLAPLLAELAELDAHVSRTLAVNEQNAEAKGMKFATNRIRARIWECLEVIREATPEEVARQLAVTPQTIRNWCRDPQVPVRHRRRGTRYLVDVRSAHEYAARRGEA